MLQQPLNKPDRFASALPFIFGFVTGLYFITLNITGHNLAFFPGDMGDARFNTYILEHAYKFFTRQDPSLWNAPFMFPEQNVITYSDNLVGSAPFYSIFRVFGTDRETAFQLWYILLVFLNYACCYWLLVKLFKNRYAAVLGAMIFAFSMALQSQLTHAQTFARYPIPLTFLAGILFIQELNPRYFFLMLLCLVYQFYCGLYLGFMLCIPAALFLISGIIYKRTLVIDKIKSAKWILQITLSAIANAILLLPLMLPYYERSKIMPHDSYEQSFHSIPTIKSFLYSQPGSLLWKSLQRMCDNYQEPWDHQLFPGGVAILGMVVCVGIALVFALKRKKTDTVLPIILFLITAALTFLLFVRVSNFSLYKYVFMMPGFGSMRALERIINIHLLFFSIAVTYVFALVFNTPFKFKIPLFIVFTGLIIIDNYCPHDASYTTSKQESMMKVNDLIEKMKSLPKGSIVSCETDKPQPRILTCQIDVMLATQSLGLKSINGYSGYNPPGYNDYADYMNADARKKWISSKNLNPDSVHIIQY